jgi:soluble lytic murein transglycosylase-like protein
MDVPTSWRTLAEMDLVYARSRRRAAARRAEPQRRSALDWRAARAAVLAVVLLGFIAETAHVELAPAKASAPKRAAVARACGIPAAFAPAFRRASRATRLPLSLLAAVAWEESRMDPHAVSGAGAQGLLQLMPGTAKAVAIGAATPDANILAGARYLRLMVDRFGGDVELALAAYNAGPARVKRWLQEMSTVDWDEFIERLPLEETRGYVKNVLRNYGVYQRLYALALDGQAAHQR